MELKELSPFSYNETLSGFGSGVSVEVDVGRIVAAAASHGCSEIVKSCLCVDSKLTLSFAKSESNYSNKIREERSGLYRGRKTTFQVDIQIESQSKKTHSSFSFAVLSGSRKKDEYSCSFIINIAPILPISPVSNSNNHEIEM
jgi:hypothetical protein